VSTVLLRHPSLPADQEIEVDRAALPHYVGSGWQQVPAEELEARQALQAKADAEARAAEQDAEADQAEAPARDAEPEAAPEPADEPSEPPTTERPARSRAKAPEKKTEES
jgi:hypothetical protein